MFSKYTSTTQIMNCPEGRQQVLDELNTYLLYVQGVELFKFREVGVRVLDPNGIETARYASHNRPDGSIEQIVDYISDNAPITIAAPDAIFLDILQNPDRVKAEVEANPIAAFGRYVKGISVNPRGYFTIMRKLPKIPALISLVRRELRKSEKLIA